MEYYGIRKRILTFASFLCLAGCLAFDQAGMETGRKANDSSQFLSVGYGALASYEEAVMRRPSVAAHYKTKASAASAGHPVEPDRLEGINLSAPIQKEIADARGKLVSMNQSAVTPESKRQLAEAQVNFDCWLMREATRDSVAGAATAPWCRERFYSAIGGISAPVERRFAIDFKNEKEVPDEEAITLIRQAAAMVPDDSDWQVHLTGHADKAAKAKQKMMLSLRRVVAVRNALIQNGVSPEVIKVGATAENRIGSDREVDILITPANTIVPDDGEEMRKLAPHYFGDSEPDL